MSIYSHGILSEIAEGGGHVVTLRARQSIRVSGIGGESAFGRPGTDEHVVTLEARGTQWKVTSFTEKEL